MRTVDLHEAKGRLSRLVAAAENGDPFIITRDGRPVVKVVAVDSARAGTTRRTGFLKGRISVPHDFDRMGSGDLEDMFGIGS